MSLCVTSLCKDKCDVVEDHYHGPSAGEILVVGAKQVEIGNYSKHVCDGTPVHSQAKERMDGVKTIVTVA